MPVKRKYRTKLFAATDEIDSLPWQPPLKGRGFEIEFKGFSFEGTYEEFARAADARRHIRVIESNEFFPDGRGRWTLSPEIIIVAPHRERAQRAVHLMAGALAILHQVAPDDEVYAIPESGVLEGLSRSEVDDMLAQGRTCDGLAQAAVFAARCSHRKRLVQASAKLCASYHCFSVPWIELHPTLGTQFRVEPDPLWRARIAHAIVAAYAAIEDLGLEIRASQKNPSKLNGAWNPVVLADLEGRLRASGVDPSSEVPWLARNPPHRIERRFGLPPGKRAVWSGGPIRDRSVRITDAMLSASSLRSKVAAHATSQWTRSLRVPDLVNVQHLARRLLLEAAGVSRFYTDNDA